MVKPRSTRTIRETPQHQLGAGMYPVHILVTVLLVALAASGCKKSKKTTIPKVVIEDIEFQGNTVFKKKTLLEHLEMGETSFLAKIGMGDKYYYSKWRTKDDRKRIIDLYRSAGYYQALVLEIKVKPVKKDPKKVKLTVTIDEGEPVLVTDIAINWASAGPDVAKVEKQIKLETGKPFDVAKLNASTASMENALYKMGFALGEVKESAKVDPSRNKATVQFEISPGPHCIIGEIRLKGLDKVPADLVAIETEFAKNKPFSPELIKRLEGRLIAMQVFYVVSVSHDTHLGENGRLGLEIAFVEGNTQTLKVGGGFAIEPDRWQIRASSQFSQHNLFGHLYDFRLRLAAGWAVLPYPWDINSHGPVALIEPSIGKKGLLEKNLFWRLTTAFEVGIEEDYKYMSPQIRLGVSRFLWDITLISLSYNLEVYILYGESDRGRKELEAAGINADGADRVAYLELSYRIMLIDEIVDQTNVAKILDPENGAIFEVVYKIASPYLGGTTQYHDIHPSIKTYWQIFSHLQLACRVATGLIFPFGDFPDPTVWSNYFLGGFNTVRAWGGKELAPREEFCVAEDDCDVVRVGGWTMVLGNVELRAMTIKELFLVAFLDVGDVQPGVLDYQPELWNYTIGGGVRYASPVGKIRVDFGYRLNNPSEYSKHQPQWGLHLGLGEAF